MICLLQQFFQKFTKCVWKIKLKHVCISVVVIALFDIFGAFTHMFEVSYNDNFVYPYNGEIQPFVDALRHNKKPEVDPINDYNYSFIHGLKEKCADPDYATLRLVFLVKSAAEHFDRRNGIRQSWGFGKRFFDVPTITIFLLGVHPNDLELQAQINAESDEYNDILQADFIDSYYNNTIKTMLGFKWAVRHCKNSKFYMFVDDDMYVSVKNVLRFIRNPAYYPDYLKEPSRRAAREIKNSDFANTTEINKNNNEFNESSSIARISKRATAKEKIAMRRKPGWTSHNKTRFPSAKSSNKVLEKSQIYLLENERKSWSNQLNETESAKPRISKRATVKEKIMRKREPGWTSRIKTEFTTVESSEKNSEKFQTELLNNKSILSDQLNKSQIPIAKSSNEVVEKSQTELLNNKRKDLSNIMKKMVNSSDSINYLNRNKRQIFDIELPDDVRLFAGYVIISSPHRHRTSKWYVSLKEYPYHLWPPYVTAGAYILSKEGLLDMYYTSLYTQHFRFDDIFLGIVAKKADIEPFHCDEFHFYKKDYTKYNYKYVITSHGYDDPDELQQVWNEQKSLGNA